MSIKKQFLKSKPICKLSFKIAASEVNSAEKVQLLGDFNNWDETVEPMTKLKTGEFTQVIELETGKEYQFKYLANGQAWINDKDSDNFVVNVFGGENGVVSTVV